MSALLQSPQAARGHCEVSILGHVPKLIAKRPEQPSLTSKPGLMLSSLLGEGGWIRTNSEISSGFGDCGGVMQGKWAVFSSGKTLVSALRWLHRQGPYKLQCQEELVKHEIPSSPWVYWNWFIFMRNVLTLGTTSFHFSFNPHWTPTCKSCFLFQRSLWHEFLCRFVVTEGPGSYQELLQ